MKTIGWNELNAYVDRELGAADAAEVAAAIARDPSLAARVATLSRLKAETSATPAPEDVPLFAVPRASRRPRSFWRPAAIAASIALLAAVGVGAWNMRAPVADPIAATVSAERAWLAGEGQAAPASGLQVAVTQAAEGGLPDLSAADLKLVYLATDPAAEGRRGVFAGYLGPRGCRLGLWIGRSGEEGPAARDLGPVRVRTWSDGPRAYALMSRTVDLDRLTRMSVAVADLIHAGQRPDERLRLALRDAAKAGAPCVG